jgi:hypothetical protein
VLFHLVGTDLVLLRKLLQIFSSLTLVWRKTVPVMRDTQVPSYGAVRLISRLRLGLSRSLDGRADFPAAMLHQHVGADPLCASRDAAIGLGFAFAAGCLVVWGIEQLGRYVRSPSPEAVGAVVMSWVAWWCSPGCPTTAT